jgi:hypothetical protein
VKLVGNVVSVGVATGTKSGSGGSAKRYFSATNVAKVRNVAVVYDAVVATGWFLSQLQHMGC